MKVFKYFKYILVIAILLALSNTMFYTVDQTEYAVIETFGKPNNEIIESGLKFKLPYPIQSVRKLSKETFSLTFGYEDMGGKEVFREQETKMITGDENIILADLEVQWKIVDPLAFLYNTNDPEKILYNITSSSLRSVIGSSTVDDALTDGRTNITNNIRDNIVNLAERYNVGVAIVNVNLQDVDLPTEDVSKAFKSVTDAREERLTKINNANKYRNEKINQVKGEQDAIISQAEAIKTKTIEKAKGDVAKFNAIYSEYIRGQEITRQRLIIDALNEVLQDTKLYIVDDNSNTVKYLPLESLEKEVSE